MKKLMLVCLCLFTGCLNVDAASTAYLALAARQKSSTQEAKQLTRYRILKVDGKIYWVDDITGTICFESRMSTREFECVNPQKGVAK